MEDQAPYTAASEQPATVAGASAPAVSRRPPDAPWIARDKCGDLYLFDCEPVRDSAGGYFVASRQCSQSFRLPKSWCRDLTWESSPVPATITTAANKKQHHRKPSKSIRDKCLSVPIS